MCSIMSLLNELSIVMSLKHLLMMSKTKKGVPSVRGDQMERQKGDMMMMAKVMIKRPEVLILETLKEWDR